ncbi:MAG: penicillin-binding protein 1C [Halothiobacillus sp. 24-54-40]|nr:MAG: penicillin-binding protein 1C [Halothiobacillus sp. 35-54-62]OYZ88002.1 MAG: penicillin-binding protein 1C [Halothiobacillus sp. 24-54-40]OZA80369.1 MAG: penicillin-binding protein 1C [Halothiobacillus sp. 39-53-45]
MRAFTHQAKRRWFVTALLVLGLPLFGLLGLRFWLLNQPHLPLSQWLPSSTAALDDKGRLLRLTLARDGQFRLWTEQKDMSPQFIQAILLHEDRYFYWAPGFNPISLVRGAFKTYVLRRHPQGGSTLTMQLARLLWQMDTKTPWGKAAQVGRAIQLELTYSKQEILTAYLNYAPFGGNIQGVGAASLIYFNHTPAQLTLPEALALAVLPQNPSRRGKITEDAANPRLIAARNRLYRHWLIKNPADAKAAALFELPLTMRRVQQLPFHAPWFVDQLLAQHTVTQSIQGGTLDDHWLHTSLDLSLQRIVQKQVVNFVQQRKIQGIHNAAALLVDTRDMGVKALVGSADYFNARIDGQVNGTNAKRSPGSALKPFIYGLGFDQGVVIPATVLRDVPTAFGSYAPENFDGRFEGPITVTQALIRSRNIPAVDVAAQLNHPSFYHFLRSAGIANMAPEDHYGLALVLGGGEVTMQELAKLYALLANHGVLKPLQFLQASPSAARQPTGTPLLSDAASYMVLDILKQNPPPLLAPTGQPSRWPVAWKTGTSSSFRDAWSVGVFGPYVLVVWVGNFDGSPNPAFIGGAAAGPLLFNITEALKAANRLAPPPPVPVPARLRRVEVCLSSGALPTIWCPRQGDSWFIPGVSPIDVDTVYRPVWVNKTSLKAVCPPYNPAVDEQKVYEFWPSELQQVFSQAGLARVNPPASAHCPYWDQAPQGSAPKITSPLLGSVYTLQLGQKAASQIALMADTDADVGALYWFADRSYLGQSKPGHPLFWSPDQPGSYVLRAVDDHGRADARDIRIAAVP